MVPLLPCASVDEIRDFFLPLGFEVTYRQLRPNPYVALKREGIDLHYFGMDGFRPEDSYGSCLIVVQDTQPLYEAFAAGLRTQFGKLPLSGFPRITRPRRRKNAGDLSGFSLIDPAGNWIRVTTGPGGAPENSDHQPARSRISVDLDNAVVFADSKGDVQKAIEILERALRRNEPRASWLETLEARIYLAELLVRHLEYDRAADLISEIQNDEVPETEAQAAAPLLRQAEELQDLLPD